ncbi:MAG: alpha-amylase family glycosyl hydrolase [Candidatus Cryptobacteroides sp.]
MAEGTLTVTPDSLTFTGEASVQQLTIETSGQWALSQKSGQTWCFPSKTFGKSSTTIEVSVTDNTPKERTAELVFSASGCPSVTVTVTQMAGESSGGGSIDADLASLKAGLSIFPSILNADYPAKIYFKADASSDLYNNAGDVYAHIGVVDMYNEWHFVPADWEENVPQCKMDVEADNIWSLTLAPSIREWFQSGETPVNKIGVVIRNADGSAKGIKEDTFFDGIIDEKYQEMPFEPDPIVTQRLPEGMHYGINYSSDNTVTLVLYDRDTAGESHKYCYVVGDWNNWERVTEGAMKRDGSAGVWWITLEGMDPSKEYKFQYRLGNDSGADTFISDPYTEIVYDQWNDQYIPGCEPFPEGARALVSAFQINRPEYAWKHKDFQIEDKNDLVIYELLLRDFSVTKDLAGAMEQLDYLQALGINAIELMPVQEFDGNLSWGYNPNHYFALDKAYGTREQYKEFIDECHGRGIAVLIDVVYNHMTGNSPWAKMFWNDSANTTSATNPWFNAVATHPFSVFHDWNHESTRVKDIVKGSLKYLLDEYDVDGFRFDLSKGFTQKNTGSDAGAWSAYDQSRINILKDYYDAVHAANPNAVMILEHFADGSEEKTLAEAGMQLWRNMNSEYRSAMGGGNGNFSGVYSNAPFGGFVGYMESHDEERICYGAAGSSDATSVSWGICGSLTGWGNTATPDIAMAEDGVFYSAKNVEFAADDMFKIRGNSTWDDAYNYGASTKGYKLPLDKEYSLTLGSGSQDMAVPAAGTYDVYFCPQVKSVWLMTQGKRPSDPDLGSADEALAQAMYRAGCCAACFLTVPGPKMIWQFGELGYDISGGNGDTDEKPVKTAEYLANPARKSLHDTYAYLLGFRKDNPRFYDMDASFTWNASGSLKTGTGSVDGKQFIVVANFGNSTSASLPSGTWKEWKGDNTYTGSVGLSKNQFKLLVNF